MPKIGAHMSIAGGISRALDRGDALGLDAIQIFTKNSNQWKSRPIKEDERRRFRQRREETGIEPVVAHDSYLINLASPDREMFERSLAAFEDEIDRCQGLGIRYLVMHPGGHLGSGELQGTRQIGEAIRVALLETESQDLVILLETTAGQGTQLGYRFEHLRDIMEKVAMPGQMGICLDTCHIFAAGYDIRTPASCDAVLEEFDRVISMEHLKLIHANDSKRELGSRVDRHEHIGQGEIGEMAFAFLLNDDRVSSLPFILETPKTSPESQVPMDVVNVSRLRNLIGRKI